MDEALVVDNIRKELKNYLEQYKLKALVIGESGGIDSAICTALAEPVCKELGVKLIGRSLPILTNKPEEIARAKAIGENFCDDFKEVDLSDMFENYSDFIYEEESIPKDETRNKIRLGNIKARVRMIYLYNLAYVHEGLVLSTDNLTELYLGFWTLHGDVGDLGMIQQLWKTEVYSVADYIAKELYKTDQVEKSIALIQTIKALPTDGLGITNSDLDQIGAKTYDDVDKILKTWLCKDEDSFCWDDVYYYEDRLKDYKEFKKYRKQLQDHPVVKRYESSHFKRNNPFNFNRGTLFKGVNNE